MPHRRLPILLACATALVIAGGCSPDPDPDGDVGVDAADTADDTGRTDAGDTTDTSDTDAGPTSATLESNGARLVVDFDPFDLTLTDADGAEKTALHRSDNPAFDGLTVARVGGYNDQRFYSPKLAEEEGKGAGREWFSARRVTGSEQVDGAWLLTLATENDDGEAGPTVGLVADTTDQGIALEAEGPDAEAFVHTSLSLEAADGEGIYGLGEHFDTLDLRGSIRQMQIQAVGDSESATNEVHVPIPFYLSTAGYGMFVEDRHPAAFDLGATVGGAVRATFNADAPTYHLYVDDKPTGLIETYTDRTGKPADVPYWALAPQWWRNETDGQSEVLDDASRGRAADIPSTLVWIDRPWSSYYHNWKFNSSQFPEPQKMFDELHRTGYRVLLHHSPQMNKPGTSDLGDDEDASEMLYQTYKENGWLVLQGNDQPFIFPWGGGDGAFVDYTEPAAVDHVQKLIKRVTKFGAVGTKMDWDEFLQPNVGILKLLLKFDNGQTNLTMHDWYTGLYHKAIIEGFDEGLGEPSFHINRSGAFGDQKWNTCIWPGDLDNDFTRHTRGPSELQEEWNVGGMPSAIMANQTLGMSGYPCFGSDIGGFRNGLPDEEVLLRWLAFGTFNAVMQLGGGGASHMPWTHDSTYSEQAVDITRKYFKLRMQLFPYIFHHLKAASRTGRPLVRSLYLAYPDDAEARTHEDTFLFGPDLLVAPVYTAGATERQVYLPDGEWIDFWTGELRQGGQTITRAAPIDVIPVFIRRGAAIPMAPEGIDTLVPAPDTSVVSYSDKKQLSVRVAPGDEERSIALFNGVEVTSQLDGGAATIDLTVGSPDGEVHEDIRFAPESVTLEVETAGTALADGPSTVEWTPEGGSARTLNEGTDCTNCWSMDDERGLVSVHVDGSGIVRVE